MTTLDEAMDRWRSLEEAHDGVVTVATNDDGAPVIRIADMQLFGPGSADPRLPGHDILFRTDDGDLAIGYPAGQPDGPARGADRDGGTCDLGTVGDLLDVTASWAEEILPGGIEEAHEMASETGELDEDDYAALLPEMTIDPIVEELARYVESRTGRHDETADDETEDDETEADGTGPDEIGHAAPEIEPAR